MSQATKRYIILRKMRRSPTDWEYTMRLRLRTDILIPLKMEVEREEPITKTQNRKTSTMATNQQKTTSMTRGRILPRMTVTVSVRMTDMSMMTVESGWTRSNPRI
jgi:hypothetical protein